MEKSLGAAVETQRLAFGLMAYAGLRPNEVPWPRRRDVRLRWKNGEAVDGFVSVWEGQSFGETHTPKTGQREVPITPVLARLLVEVEQGARDGLVAVNRQGKTWGQTGLVQAFERVRRRVGLEGWSVYGWRHYVITSWLRAGVPVHVVQRMAGHKHLGGHYTGSAASAKGERYAKWLQSGQSSCSAHPHACPLRKFDGGRSPPPRMWRPDAAA